MNKIEQIQRRLRERFPRAVVRLSEPADSDGCWVLDVQENAVALVVEWTPQDRWGVSALDDQVEYGEGSDEVLDDADSVYQRVETLLTTDEQASVQMASPCPKKFIYKYKN